MPPTKFQTHKPWLLDHNIPAVLKRWLKTQSIEAETVAEQHWEEFSDTRLVRMADRKFGVLLTRDRRFVEAARHALANSPLAVVFVNLRQAPAEHFVRAFGEAWSNRPIEIAAGEHIQWP